MALLDIPHSVVTLTMQFLITGYEHSLMLETTRTYQAKIANHSQVSDDLDQCGFSASKLWNVARYYTQGRWDEDGEIPDDGENSNPNSRNTNDTVTSILSQLSEFSKN